MKELLFGRTNGLEAVPEHIAYCITFGIIR